MKPSLNGSNLHVHAPGTRMDWARERWWVGRLGMTVERGERRLTTPTLITREIGVAMG